MPLNLLSLKAKRFRMMKTNASMDGLLDLEKISGDSVINIPITMWTNRRLESGDRKPNFNVNSLPMTKISIDVNNMKTVHHSFSNGSHNGYSILKIIL